MGPQGRGYLEELYRHLAPMPEEDRLDAVKEIESHLEEAVRHGQTEQALIHKLGDARKLAKAYIGEYYVSAKSPRSKTWQHISFIESGSLFRQASSACSLSRSFLYWRAG